MSVEAITWALELKVQRSSAKFVLVAMANCANSDMTCWPSIQYLSDATGQDRKTVLENIKRLKDDGFISDTAERKGHTGQVIVYRLNSSENGTVKQSRKRNSPENGTVPKTDGNSTVFPVKQSRFSVETVPKTGHGTVKEPSGNHKTTRDSFDPEIYLQEKGVDPQIVKDWLKHRKVKRADVSKTVIDGHVREAKNAGLSLQAALSMAVERGWTGFKAEWVQQPRGSPKYQSRQDKEREWIGALTGNKNANSESTIIDIN